MTTNNSNNNNTEAPGAEAGAQIAFTNAVLLVLPLSNDTTVPRVAESFCGTVVTNPKQLPDSFKEKTVYLCGDISALSTSGADLSEASSIFVVKQASRNFDGTSFLIVDAGRLPVSVHGVGILYRQFFDDLEGEMFRRISTDHEFQQLTESNKPGTAFRTGAYLTPVEQKGDDLHFNLLRCSSNLSGPTLNFRDTDRMIVGALNEEAGRVFDNAAPMNHVLAQIYHNRPSNDHQKQAKAKIKAHSDKTKDMPQDGVMAFVTFYDGLHKLHPMPNDPYDYGYKGPSGDIKESGLTTLRFQLKEQAAKRPWCRWTPQFDVTLYPGSVFMMPLSTNRLYTHEIRPSSLDADKLPTRMGYVVRCSNTPAVFRNGQTHLVKTVPGKGTELIPLQTPAAEAARGKGPMELRDLYYKENVSDELVDYGTFLFSMNKGDYQRPVTYTENEEFRVLTLETDSSNMFQELQETVPFEDICKGRQGAVLVRPHTTRGTPIVRTTTSYTKPAQPFSAAHQRLAQQIQNQAGLPNELNNALIEIYDNAYGKMGFHSDQALDLLDDSHIAIYSCYQFSEQANPPPRKLVVESKESDSVKFEIPLEHNSVVVFSLDTNRRFKHKIVLDHTVLQKNRHTENPWLGVTFRTSKTFVQNRGDGQAVLEDGSPLVLANQEQRKEFFRLRGAENRETNFAYPVSVGYTISESDLAAPRDGS